MDHFQRRVLLTVTGMSPQIVTETLYALIQQKKFIPTEIKLITTELGRNRAIRDLLNAQDGKFHAFCNEYDLKGQIHFDVNSIELIRDKDGQVLPDIRTPEENAHAADTIMQTVQQLCTDPDLMLHASIAGGRKTMGFYLGYALSLFARPQDTLSHVLVSEPYESNWDFFYPSPHQQQLVTASGETLDASKAVVMLAEIPLVRLRAGLPNDLLIGNVQYSQAVAAAQKAQTSLHPVQLELKPDRLEIVCGGVLIKLPPIVFAMLFAFAQYKLKGAMLQPGKNFNEQDFLKIYKPLAGDMSYDYEQASRTLLSEVNDFKQYLLEKKSLLKKILVKSLGIWAKPYLIVTHRKNGVTAYELEIAKENILIQD